MKKNFIAPVIEAVTISAEDSVMSSLNPGALGNAGSGVTDGVVISPNIITEYKTWQKQDWI